MVYPSTSKTPLYSSRGSDLQLREKEVPPLAASEILVRVHAASINPVDVQLWQSGLVAVVAGDKGMGRDFSGTVLSVGKDVRGWAEGDDIFGLHFKPGTFSQYINIDPTSTPIAKKPCCFSHETAASIPLVAVTAYACLEWLPPPRTSQRRAVVQGASGGNGVTGRAASIGADEVIDYTSQDVVKTLLSARRATLPMDLIIDCVGGTELVSVYGKRVQRKYIDQQTG